MLMGPGVDGERGNRRCSSSSGFDHQHHRALFDFVAHGHAQFLDHARGARGNFHRGLVGFDGDEGLLHFHGVAHFDQQLDDGHFVEIANVWDFYFYQCHDLSPGFRRTEGSLFRC
jgi:hypothetical protein